MDIEREVIQINVLPEHEGRKNVIGSVMWRIVFTDEGVESVAAIHTVLDVYENQSDYVDIENLSDDDIMDRCIGVEGGDDFLTVLAQNHSQEIARKKLFNALVVYEREA